MASRRKMTTKKKAGSIDPRLRSEALPVIPESNSNFKFVLVGLVVLACAYAVFRAFQGSEKPKDYKVRQLMSLAVEGQPCGPFTPWGIAPIGKDKIVVADTNHSRLLEFDRYGKFIRSWGKLGKGPLKFHEPSGMTFDDNGNAYVMDAWNGAIKGFNENGKEILDLALGDNNGFYGPRGVAFDGQNFVIADTGSHRIVRVTPKGVIVSSWGKLGGGSGEFNGPLDVAADGKGDYFVADSGNNRLQWMNSQGKILRTYKYDGSVPAVAVDKEGRFYVAISSARSRVKAYDSNGDYLGDLVVDQGGSADAFRSVHSMNVGPGDVLMVSTETGIFLYQLPAVGNT